ncbi:ATP-binding protein [Streptomyces coerulescens]|uniref:ATP-binding protein n=1 Tax=Streptomyces coerulescens TaxID=29304 RepID=A0ABW0CY05_STRCD
MEELTFTTELIVSELVTNAIRYGSGPIQLRLIRDRALICEVSDGRSTAPHLRYAHAADEGGRGLFLVAQLAGRWEPATPPEARPSGPSRRWGNGTRLIGIFTLPAASDSPVAPRHEFLATGRADDEITEPVRRADFWRPSTVPATVSGHR